MKRTNSEAFSADGTQGGPATPLTTQAQVRPGRGGPRRRQQRPQGRPGSAAPLLPLGSRSFPGHTAFRTTITHSGVSRRVGASCGALLPAARVPNLSTDVTSSAVGRWRLSLPHPSQARSPLTSEVAVAAASGLATCSLTKHCL